MDEDLRVENMEIRNRLDNPFNSMLCIIHRSIDHLSDGKIYESSSVDVRGISDPLYNIVLDSDWVI